LSYGSGKKLDKEPAPAPGGIPPAATLRCTPAPPSPGVGREPRGTPERRGAGPAPGPAPPVGPGWRIS